MRTSLAGPRSKFGPVSVSSRFSESYDRHEGDWLPPMPPRTLLAFGVALPVLAIALFFVMSHDKPLAPTAAASPPIILAQAQDLPLRSGFDPFAESRIRTRVEPVSLILIAPDTAAVTAAFARVGWEASAHPNLPRLVDAALAAWTNHSDPVAPSPPISATGRPKILPSRSPMRQTACGAGTICWSGKRSSGLPAETGRSLQAPVSTMA